MICRARELLTQHKGLLSREAVLTSTIESLRVRTTSDEGIITAMTLGHMVDGMPSLGNHGSQTEYVAAHYKQQMRNEEALVREEIASAIRELWYVRKDLSLYAAVLASLNDAERQFIQLYYDDGYSMNSISEMEFSRGTRYSSRTLSRMNNMVLKKIGCALMPNVYAEHGRSV